MPEPKLISIIIPTYNRAHLIEETLDSIRAQGYSHWECLVVDDGSTDNTGEVVNEFVAKDSRFQYHQRPDHKPKGANACRNHGLELSSGEFVNWFDSDDLMTTDFLESKVEFLMEQQCDFVYSDTVNFDGKNPEAPMFDIPAGVVEVNADNFIKQTLAWSTPDFMCRRESIGSVRFNEHLKSGQEFNFFSQYLLKDVRGRHLDKVLTKRRVHDQSIQNQQRNEKHRYLINKYNVYFKTYKDILPNASQDSLNYLLNLAMSKSFELASMKTRTPEFTSLVGHVSKNKGLSNAVMFVTSIIAAFVFGAGHSLMNKSRN